MVKFECMKITFPVYVMCFPVILIGYDDLTHIYPKEYRNNDRVMVEDERFVGIVYERIRSNVERFVVRSEESNETYQALHEIERRPIGLNSRMRICMYHEGGIFGGHRDSHVQFGRQKYFATFMYVFISH